MNPSRNPPAAVIALRDYLMAKSRQWHLRAGYLRQLPTREYTVPADAAETLNNCADELDALLASLEPPTQEQGSVRYWLAEAVRDLNRARGEITTPAEDRLVDVCGALIAALAAHRAPPTQEPTP